MADATRPVAVWPVGRERMVCRAARPSAVLAEMATRAPASAYGHGTTALTQKSPKTQSDSEAGLVPRSATT